MLVVAIKRLLRDDGESETRFPLPPPLASETSESEMIHPDENEKEEPAKIKEVHNNRSITDGCLQHTQRNIINRISRTH